MRDAVAQIGEESQSRGHHCVFEGVHLLPELYPPAPRRLHVLLRDTDPRSLQARIQKKFSRRPELAQRWTEEKIAQIIRVQNYLVESGEEHGLLVVDVTSPERALSFITARLQSLLVEWGEA